MAESEPPLMLVSVPSSLIEPPVASMLPPWKLVLPVAARSTLARLVCSCTPSLRLRSEAVVEPWSALVEPIRITPAVPEPVDLVSISPGPLISRGAVAAGATVMAPPLPEPDALLLILLLSPSWRDLVLRLMLP
ncbi:MAG: hypothetical protein ACK5RA_13005, partial [Cyanobacteriota bacterium]